MRRNLQRLVRSHFHRLFPFISQIVFVLPSVHPVTAAQHHSFSSSNVSVQVRRLVRRNLQRLVRSHFHWLFPFISQIVFVLPSVHPVTVVQHHSFSSSNVRGQGTRHLVEGTLDPLVGKLCLFILLRRLNMYHVKWKRSLMSSINGKIDGIATGCFKFNAIDIQYHVCADSIALVAKFYG